MPASHCICLMEIAQGGLPKCSAGALAVRPHDSADPISAPTGSALCCRMRRPKFLHALRRPVPQNPWVYYLSLLQNSLHLTSQRRSEGRALAALPVQFVRSRRRPAEFRRAFSAPPPSFGFGLGTDRQFGASCCRTAYVMSRISCSTVTATIPNIKWQKTLGAPRTRTWLPPWLSFRLALTRSAELRWL